MNSGVFPWETRTIHIELLFRNAPGKRSWTGLSLVWFAGVAPDVRDRTQFPDRGIRKQKKTKPIFIFASKKSPRRISTVSRKSQADFSVSNKRPNVSLRKINQTVRKYIPTQKYNLTSEEMTSKNENDLPWNGYFLGGNWPGPVEWGFGEGLLKDKFAFFEADKNPIPKRSKLLIERPIL